MIHSDFLNFLWGRFYSDRCEIVHIRVTKHVVKDIEHEDRLVAASKLSEWSFLRHTIHRQAVIPKLLDIHFLNLLMIAIVKCANMPYTRVVNRTILSLIMMMCDKGIGHSGRA